jgi:hypothetical protein
MLQQYCSATAGLLYWAMLGAAAVFSCYLLSTKSDNPYNNRRPFRDAKNGNTWAKLVVWYTYAFGLVLVWHFACLLQVKT